MNKAELIDAVSVKAGIAKTVAQTAVDALFDTIQSTLKKGDEVRVVGFGTFAVSERAASEGRNPRTGETIKIPARKQPKFRPGKELKEAVND